MELLLPILFSFILLCGAFFALIPGLPTMFFLLVIALIFAVVDGFTHLSSSELLILVGIYALSFLVDLFSGALGAKYGGASLRSIGLGIGGAIIGMIIFPPFGAILGLFVAVLLSEYFRNGDSRQAIRAAAFGALGTVAGLIINIVLAAFFFGTFIALVFFLN